VRLGVPGGVLVSDAVVLPVVRRQAGRALRRVPSQGEVRIPVRRFALLWTSPAQTRSAGNNTGLRTTPPGLPNARFVPVGPLESRLST
jgi:hypothetical protein